MLMNFYRLKCTSNIIIDTLIQFKLYHRIVDNGKFFYITMQNTALYVHYHGYFMSFTPNAVQ